MIKMVFRGKRVIQWAGLLLALSCLAGISGCVTVGPDYTRPEVSVYKEWNNSLNASTIAGIAPNAAHSALNQAAGIICWEKLGDPLLADLIKRALKGNLDLKRARARVLEARARRGISQADFFPKLDTTDSASRSKNSENSGGITSDLYRADFDAGWELDIFGGVRRATEAAQANLEATQAQLDGVLVSLVGETAINYINVRVCQSKLALLEANLKHQELSQQLVVLQQRVGLGDETAVQKSRLRLENIRSQIPLLRSGMEEALNHIAVLLGEQPGKTHAELREHQALPKAAADIAAGVPLDVVRSRPDVRQAERELAMQTAKVGVAVTDLYPKLRLSGVIGFSAVNGGDLLLSGSRANSLGVGISIPIFAGGALRQNIAVQSALQEQYLAAYETSVLKALEEVENALAAYAAEQSRCRDLQGASNAARQSAELAEQEYLAGLSDFISVLDANSALLASEDALIQSEGTALINFVRLYKALGGGWAVQR